MSRYHLEPPGGVIEPIPCIPVGGPGANGLWQAGDCDGARVERHGLGVIAFHTWSCVTPPLRMAACFVGAP